jgi:hypothetical protein
MIATACLRSDAPQCILRAVCARYGSEVRADGPAEKAEVDLGFACCVMRADASHLALLLEADGPVALLRAQRTVVRALARCGPPDGVAVAWTGAAAPPSPIEPPGPSQRDAPTSA